MVRPCRTSLVSQVMGSDEDAVLLALWQGRGSWDGSAADATEIASYLEEDEQLTVPRTADAIDRILTDLLAAGFVAIGSRPLSMSRGMQMYRPYVLTETGLARAHELEAIDEHFPPHGDTS
jgi:hypothetical protein